MEAIHIRTLNPKLNRDKGLELVRPSLGQPFRNQGDQGAKWKFFSGVTNIYDVR